MRRSWMLGHLAQETQDRHAAADGDRLAIMERPTIERYRAYLGQIYCFEAPIEAALLATDGADRRILRTHLKSHRLLADLDALGFPTREARPVEVTPFETPVDALAWLWVLHRNTLLHGLIHRYVAGKLPETVTVAGAYLSSFEGQAGALMRELGDTLDHAIRRASLAERVVRAAKDAFRMQRQWYSCDFLSPMRPSAPPHRAPSQAA
jgi:heme oxygenase